MTPPYVQTIGCGPLRENAQYPRLRIKETVTHGHAALVVRCSMVLPNSPSYTTPNGISEKYGAQPR